jgi:hypothetical protein
LIDEEDQPSWLERYGQEEVVNAITDEGHGFRFERHREAGKPTPLMKRTGNPSVWWVLSNVKDRRTVWTPAQEEAVTLVYGAGLTITEAADRLDITKQAFDERLSKAEVAAGKTRWRLRRARRKKGRTGQALPFHEAEVQALTIGAGEPWSGAL